MFINNILFCLKLFKNKVARMTEEYSEEFDDDRLTTPDSDARLNSPDPMPMEICQYGHQNPPSNYQPNPILMANPNGMQYFGQQIGADLMMDRNLANASNANYLPANPIIYSHQTPPIVQHSFDGVPPLFQPFAAFYQKISQLLQNLYGAIEKYQLMPELTNNINISIGILSGLQAALNNPIFVTRECSIPLGIFLDRKLQNMLAEQPFISVGSEANRKDEYGMFQRETNSSFMEISSKINDKLCQICAHIGNYGALQNEVQWADPSFEELRRISKELFEQLLLTTIQPPPFHVKVVEKSKKSIYDFITEFGIFCANALLENVEQNLTIECKLMERDSQNQMEIFETEHFRIVSKENLQNDHLDEEIQNSTFRRFKMRICGKAPIRKLAQIAPGGQGIQPKRTVRRNTPWSQYFIRWSVHVRLKHGIELTKSVDTFPFLIFTIPVDHLDGQAFIERIFPEKMERGEMFTATNVMLKALERKFQAVATRPPKEWSLKEESEENVKNKRSNCSIASISVSSTSLPTLASSSSSSNPSPISAQKNVFVRNFFPTHMDNLMFMMVANVPENGFVKIENYLKQLSIMSKQNGDVVAFHEWFLSLPKLMCKQKLYCKLWNKGIIFFCGKREAEELVMQSGPGTFLVRVSNTEFETFKITAMRIGKIEVEHIPCAFYSNTEPLMLQMKQHYCYLNASNVLKWSKSGTMKSVDFAKFLEKFDKSEFNHLLEMRKKKYYAPNDGKGFQANAEYQRNQKPFGTDSYLRQKWKLWKK